MGWSERQGMTKAINIILDESQPQSPLFVEIETDEGTSIRIGERIEYDGLTRLRITQEDIHNAIISTCGRRPSEPF